MDTNIPKIEIGPHRVDLFQGGMGVGISRWHLASAVINEGGVGTLPAVGLAAHLGLLNGVRTEEGYVKVANEALRYEIAKIRKNSNGVLAVNVMGALSNNLPLMQTAVDEKVDMIVFGAGIIRKFPQNAKNMLWIPVVSSGRSALLTTRSLERSGYKPAGFIVEGPLAGGHLGYSTEELTDLDFLEHGLERRVKEVIYATKDYRNFGRKVPVIAAGGIFYGGDIRRAIEEWGAAGAQLATRFVPTIECDAPQQFKDAYLRCERGDIMLIKSPVGLPGRALRNQFLIDAARGKRFSFDCPYHCLTSCEQDKAQYCIADALFNAEKGDLKEGFVFCGANTYRCKEDGSISVQELFKKLQQEYKDNKRS